MHKQIGISLFGFIMWSVVVVFAALLGFKIGPPYFEYLTIQNQLKAIANDPDSRSGLRRDIENAFGRRSTIEDIRSIKPGDLQITKVGDTIVISAEYTVCVHIVANIKACMDYYPSSEQR
jgi:hypothetical protein